MNGEIDYTSCGAGIIISSLVEDVRCYYEQVLPADWVSKMDNHDTI